MILEFAGDLPIGSQEWKAMQINALCNREEGYLRKLTLTQCYPHKFTCSSGHCIPLEDRCDIGFDCKDHTDEKDCHLIQTGKHYTKEILPVSESLDPCVIYMNVSILAFPVISTKDVKFTADFYLNLKWHDLRINLWDLNHKFTFNRLSKNDEETIWIPKLSFINSLGPVSAIGSSTSFVIRENDPLEEEISLTTEGTIV